MDQHWILLRLIITVHKKCHSARNCFIHGVNRNYSISKCNNIICRSSIIIVWLVLIASALYFIVGFLAFLLQVYEILDFAILLILMSLPAIIVVGPVWFLIQSWITFSKLQDKSLREQFSLTPVSAKIMLRCYLEKNIKWSILPALIIVIAQGFGLFYYWFWVLNYSGTSFLQSMILLNVIVLMFGLFLLCFVLCYVYLLQELFKGFSIACTGESGNSVFILCVGCLIKAVFTSIMMTVVMGFLHCILLVPIAALMIGISEILNRMEWSYTISSIVIFLVILYTYRSSLEFIEP